MHNLPEGAGLSLKSGADNIYIETVCHWVKGSLEFRVFDLHYKEVRHLHGRATIQHVQMPGWSQCQDFPVA